MTLFASVTVRKSLTPNFIKWNKLENFTKEKYIQNGAWKTGPPSRRPTWAQVPDSVQEIKQMQITYWLEKALKMISLYVNALTYKEIIFSTFSNQ